VVLLAAEPPFEPLVDGATLEFVYGAQGGYHINLALELRGLGVDPTIELFGEIDGTRLAEGFLVVDGECEAGRVLVDGVWLIWGTTPEVLHQAAARVEARATDAEGRSVSTKVDLVILDPLR
jgi:hypothetical protein